MKNRAIKKRYLFVLVVGAILQTGCSTVGYYAQAVNGHFKLMRGRQSVEKLIQSPDTDQVLREKLELLVSARQYASEVLELPQNNSYSSYVATGRKYVTWNVVAAPEFSLQPKTWCFPIAGCVSYRGYFAEEDAQSYAMVLRQDGFDTSVGGASAYSTLGWFDDPLMDTMMRGGELSLVSVLFHELSHQKLYVKDDSNFNEAYASFVEQVGVRRWLEDQDKAAAIPAYDAYLQRQIEFGELLSATRSKLVDTFNRELNEDEKRVAKEQVFASMREDYARLKEQWDGYSGYDNWFKRELNNARLVAVATYRQWVPAFAQLFAENDRNFTRFYEAAEKIGKLPKAQRTKELTRLLESAL